MAIEILCLVIHVLATNQMARKIRLAILMDGKKDPLSCYTCNKVIWQESSFLLLHLHQFQMAREIFCLAKLASVLDGKKYHLSSYTCIQTIGLEEQD